MSYIRNTSNPEYLYIYACSNNLVHIHEGSKPAFVIPKKIFETAILKFEIEEKINYKNFIIDIVRVYGKNNKLFKKRHKGKCKKIFCCIEGTETKIRLRWKSHSVIMWPVTFEYISYRVHKINNRSK